MSSLPVRLRGIIQGVKAATNSGVEAPQGVEEVVCGYDTVTTATHWATLAL